VEFVVEWGMSDFDEEIGAASTPPVQKCSVFDS